MVIEARKLQRLGSSSLVVTLPREWVKRMGLEPGDTVYVSIEGEALRIIPASESKRKGKVDAIFHADKLRDKDLISKTVSCLYILGYDSVLFKLAEDDFKVKNDIRAAASRLAGFEVSESLDGNITVRYLLDPTKVDASSTIKGVGVIVSSLAKLVKKILVGLEKNEASKIIQLLRQELFRNQHMVMRYLVSRSTAITGMSDSGIYSLMIGTSLLGLIGGILVDTAYILLERSLEYKEVLLEATTILEELVPTVASLLVTPTLQRTLEALKQLNEALSLVSKRMKACKSNVETITLSMIYEAFKVLMIILNTILCNAIVSSRYIETID